MREIERFDTSISAGQGQDISLFNASWDVHLPGLMTRKPCAKLKLDRKCSGLCSMRYRLKGLHEGCEEWLFSADVGGGDVSDKGK